MKLYADIMKVKGVFFGTPVKYRFKVISQGGPHYHLPVLTPRILGDVVDKLYKLLSQIHILTGFSIDRIFKTIFPIPGWD